MSEIRTGDWEYEEADKSVSEEKQVLATGDEDYIPMTEIHETASAQPAVRDVEPSPPQDNRVENIEEILKKLIKISSEIEASALISHDGLIMAAVLPEGVEEDRIAAMSAAILSLGEKASIELGKGELSQVFVEGDNGFVFLMSAEGKAVLTAIASRKAKLGLVFYDMKNIAKEIASLL